MGTCSIKIQVPTRLLKVESDLPNINRWEVRKGRDAEAWPARFSIRGNHSSCSKQMNAMAVITIQFKTLIAQRKKRLVGGASCSEKAGS